MNDFVDLLMPELNTQKNLWYVRVDMQHEPYAHYLCSAAPILPYIASATEIGVNSSLSMYFDTELDAHICAEHYYASTGATVYPHEARMTQLCMGLGGDKVPERNTTEQEVMDFI
jgi:hypothetical protein